MAGPVHPQNYLSSDGVLSVANANDDGVTGTYVDLATGTASGNDQIDGIDFFADTVVTLGLIRIFVYDGASAVLIPHDGFIVVPAITPVLTQPMTPNWQQTVLFRKPVRLPSTSHVLRLNTHVGEVIRCRSFGHKHV